MNLAALSRTGLKKVAKEIKIKGFATMKKDALQDAICAKLDEDDSLFDTVEELVEQIMAETPEKPEAKNASLGVKELTFNGKTQSIAAWADEVGLARPALYDRINRHGWSVEEALTIPKGGRRKKPEVEDQIAMDDVEDEDDDE